jgi:flagellar biosynthesis protein
MNEKNVKDKVVALKYRDKEDRAPRVVAKGEGVIARKIKDIALKQGIPIHHDNDLVELLAQIEVDREIPPELYSAIAEILSWIYKANTTMKKEQSIK